MKTIFERLREDHDKQRTLLDLIGKTQGDSEGRRELFDRLVDEMDAHAVAEERTFYARLLKEKTTQEKSRHSVAEHKDLDDSLDELKGMAFSSPHWLPKFQKFADCARHHLNEEEHEVFQMAGKVLDEAEKTGMTERFDELKYQAATS